jgi:hypothetical protein
MLGVVGRPVEVPGELAVAGGLRFFSRERCYDV